MTLKRFCRLCAVKCPLSSIKSKEDLQNEQLDKLILQHLHIKIEDGYPNTACKLCCKTISNFHKLLTGIKTAQQKLSNIFSDSKNLDIKLEDEEQSKILDKNSDEINLDLEEYKETDATDNVKTEIDDHNNDDYYDIDHFLNLKDETPDFDSSIAKPGNEVSETEKLNIDTTNDENLQKSSDSNLKKNQRKIHWRCYKCKKRLRNAESLQDHFQEVHKSKVEYVCVECQALFKDLSEFKDHYYSHDIVKKSKKYPFNYTCETCGKQFYEAKNYKEHRDMHLGIKRFECEICGKNFAKKQHKEIHKLRVCSKSKKINTVDELIKDEISDNNQEPKWKCNKCDKGFETVHYYQKHLKKAHDVTTNDLICTVCDELFESNELYDEHLKKVHDIDDGIQTGSNYECKKCSKHFRHKYSYLAHTLTHTGVKRFSCKECGSKFYLKQHLIAHSLTHLETVNSSERKFMNIETLTEHQKQGHNSEEVICDQCGKVLKDKYRLTQHLSSHIDGIKFTCDQCPKEFKSTAALKLHQKKHGEKQHGCEVCGRKFSLRSQLRVHATIHTGQLPYECSYCKKQFRTKYHLTVHLRQHTGERPYSCTECNHYFANDSNFIKHLKGRHGLKNFSIVNKHRYPFDD
ncbi:zinc finger protein 182-like [Chrysoperla carnea]|uniref:zinc finger protein 182-like n=1 Tax=Chrysoperla carnea TaxID=189513 RepID=UPI001D08A78D|nr:zinc finger protein 182-like [Chrysoperla carnea]